MERFCQRGCWKTPCVQIQWNSKDQKLLIEVFQSLLYWYWSWWLKFFTHPFQRLSIWKSTWFSGKKKNYLHSKIFQNWQGSYCLCHERQPQRGAAAKSYPLLMTANPMIQGQVYIQLPKTTAESLYNYCLSHEEVLRSAPFCLSCFIFCIMRKGKKTYSRSFYPSSERFFFGEE